MAKRILIVEDFVDLRRIVAAVLTRVCGYEVVEAANGWEAVKMSVSEQPDLILMDIDLPDCSGIEAARVVKSNPNTAHIPIVMQTGWRSSHWQTAALSVGIAGFLQKPVSMEVIISTIEKFL